MLGDDELARIAVVGASEGVLEYADGLEHVAHDLDLVREVRGIAQNRLPLVSKVICSTPVMVALMPTALPPS